jgi:hypothetical protein
LPSAGWATVVPSNWHYRAKPTQIQMDAMNTEYQTYGTTYTACNYSLWVYWCHWTMSTSNWWCRGWEATTISSSNLWIVNWTTIEWVNIPFSSNSYQIDWWCWPIWKYPAMKICQNMWAWWKLPTIFELWQICYDSNSCSSIRNVLSLEPQWHWSSTEYSAGYARILNMNSGDVSNSDKESNLYVICYHD